MSSDFDFNQNTSASFDNTAWTAVLEAAGHDDSPGALERLCRIYWPPIYSFLRRQGRSREDAADLTQGFFLHLLDKERNRLGSVHPAKGKFRSFLLACLNNYVSNEWDKGQAQKRGGGQAPVPFDVSEEETRMWEPSDNEDPETIFLRNWAKRLIDQVFDQLKMKCAQAGKSRQFEVLAPFLTGEALHGGYAVAAANLQISEGAARVAATRLRQEFGDLLKTEVGRTVSDPSEIKEEINYLIGVLRRR